MVAPLTPDEARLAAIREALPAVGAGIYLNTAAAGPLPAETARVMADEAAREATLGRAHPADADETLERVAEARAAMAAILATDLDTVALTRGLAHGLELACATVPWRQGDRAVLLTDGTGVVPWPVGLLRNVGVEVTKIPVAGLANRELLRTVETAVGAGARLVGLPQVLETTGQMLPVAAVANLAHDAQAVVALDGSQSVGAIPVRASGLIVDLVAFPSERWLLGPAGLGGLWCGPGVVDQLVALYGAGFADPSRAAQPEPAATLAPWHRPSVVGFARSCGLLSMQVGLAWAWERAGALARRAAEALRSVDGVEVLTPADMATIVVFHIRGWGAAAALDELGARIFAIAGLVPALDSIRISPGAWNTEDEIDRFVEGVALLAAHTPESLPPRRTLNVLG